VQGMGVGGGYMQQEQQVNSRRGRSTKKKQIQSHLNEDLHAGFYYVNSGVV